MLDNLLHLCRTGRDGCPGWHETKKVVMAELFLSSIRLTVISLLRSSAALCLGLTGHRLTGLWLCFTVRRVNWVAILAFLADSI